MFIGEPTELEQNGSLVVSTQAKLFSLITRSFP